MKKDRNGILGLILRIILFVVGLVFMVLLVDLLNLKIFGVILVLLVYIVFSVVQYMIRNKNVAVRFLSTLLTVVLIMFSITLSKVKPSTIPALNYKANKTEVVHLEKGDIQGIITSDDKVEVYTAIPYATYRALRLLAVSFSSSSSSLSLISLSFSACFIPDSSIVL